MHATPTTSPLEIWGGVECSVVRVPGRVENQLARTGHLQRVEDLERFAALGLRTLRFPVLWEHHAGDPIDWRETDQRLQRVRELSIRPIVGFVHHGSGPLRDGLLDSEFATGLAKFAAEFARRYPWIDAYTPVNEPLTTARFSGLYGLWHPFRTDAKSFARIFLNECEGIRAAMKAMREIVPHAQLVQTEDIGKTHSTEFLAYQAGFENERRWLTFDLLSGKLSPGHAARKHLLAAGISAAELDSFRNEPCVPDLFGVNYYVTSERFLDERVQRYPRECRGGNEHQVYADVPAVRVREEGLCGPAFLLRELWTRYHRPIAVTEVQIACTREEQLRWLMEIWHAARALRAEGIDVRAITAWALLGAYDWDSLLRENRGHYENGAFDCRSRPPRPTAVAHAIRSLAETGSFEHPALPGPGWWRRPFRLEFAAVSAPRTGPGTALNASRPRPREAPPLLILGASGTLGSALVRMCRWRGLHAVAVSRREFDLAPDSDANGLLEKFRPWALINAAGFTGVDAAEHDPSACHAVNTIACASLAAVCAERDVRHVTFSSAFVFDGVSERPYLESDPPAPLNHYGRSKFAAEQAILRLGGTALIIRSSAFFGPWSQANFVPRTLERLQRGESVRVSEDVVISPTYVPDLVNAALDLLIDGETGIWHAANQGAITWHGWARALAECVGVPAERVLPATAEELGWVARRPLYAALSSERGVLLPSWEKALERFMAERTHVDHAVEPARR